MIIFLRRKFFNQFTNPKKFKNMIQRINNQMLLHQETLEMQYPIFLLMNLKKIKQFKIK